MALEATDRTLTGRYLWDPWPVLTEEGEILEVGDRELWVALVTDNSGQPEDRHDHARQHLILVGSVLEDLGPLFPEHASLGSREWSGSTVFDRRRGRLIAYYTAAGRRGETARTYEQRIAVAEGSVTSDASFRVTSWSPHREVLAPVRPYLASGFGANAQWLSAFRDPSWFRDSADGSEYLLLAASVADAQGCGPWGAVGLACRVDDTWTLGAPLMTTAGRNRELERPHLIARDGLYYLFVSTQQHVFTADTPGPTGLYGYVASDVSGPYRPVNGSGLVIANPTHRPHEAYAWLVLEDLRVAAFLNYPDEPPGEARPRAGGRFAGGLAPWRHLRLNGDIITVAKKTDVGESS